MDAKKAALLDRVKNDFCYHKPPLDVINEMAELRSEALRLAEMYIHSMPMGRDLSMALSHLEEASRCAIAGLAKEHPTE